MTPARAVTRPQAARAGSTSSTSRQRRNGVTMTASTVAARPARPWTTMLDGKRLRQLRRERGLSQEQLADRAGSQSDYGGQARTADRRHRAAGGQWPGSPPRSTSSQPRLSPAVSGRNSSTATTAKPCDRCPAPAGRQGLSADCRNSLPTLADIEDRAACLRFRWSRAGATVHPLYHRRTRRARAQDVRRRKREGIGTCAAHRGQPPVPRPPLRRPFRPETSTRTLLETA